MTIYDTEEQVIIRWLSLSLFFNVNNTTSEETNPKPVKYIRCLLFYN